MRNQPCLNSHVFPGTPHRIELVVSYLSNDAMLSYPIVDIVIAESNHVVKCSRLEAERIAFDAETVAT